MINTQKIIIFLLIIVIPMTLNAYYQPAIKTNLLELKNNIAKVEVEYRYYLSIFETYKDAEERMKKDVEEIAKIFIGSYVKTEMMVRNDYAEYTKFTIESPKLDNIKRISFNSALDKETNLDYIQAKYVVTLRLNFKEKNYEETTILQPNDGLVLSGNMKKNNIKYKIEEIQKLSDNDLIVKITAISYYGSSDSNSSMRIDALKKIMEAAQVYSNPKTLSEFIAIEDKIKQNKIETIYANHVGVMLIDEKRTITNNQQIMVETTANVYLSLDSIYKENIALSYDKKNLIINRLTNEELHNRYLTYEKNKNIFQKKMKEHLDQLIRPEVFFVEYLKHNMQKK